MRIVHKIQTDVPPSPGVVGAFPAAAPSRFRAKGYLGADGWFLLDFAGEDFFLGGIGLSGTGAGCVTGGGGDNAKTQAPASFR